MVERVAGPEIERLVQLLARLPGLGPRSARRAVLQLIRKRDELLSPLADAMQVARERIVICSCCGNIDTKDPCIICCDERRDPTILVVVETVAFCKVSIFVSVVMEALMESIAHFGLLI